MTIDQSVLYDSREMSDQHRDMRLDIDNMSYEVTKSEFFFLLRKE